jgi:hypothetical protein
MMYPILRFSGAVKKDLTIDAWLAEQPQELGVMATEWFSKIRKCGPDVLELMHDGHPTACVEDGPFAYVNVFKAHVNVGFFHGASLPDPKHLLEGTGKYMRHTKLKPGVSVDALALETLIASAYTDIKERLKNERSTSKK